MNPTTLRAPVSGKHLGQDSLVVSTDMVRIAGVDVATLKSPVKTSAITLRLARTMNYADLATGPAADGKSSSLVLAAADHLTEAVTIASAALVDVKVFGEIELDYPLEPSGADDLPLAILLVKPSQTVAIPVVWTARAVTFGASSINPYPVIIALGAQGAGVKLTTFVADIVTVFFGQVGKQSKAAMTGEFVELQEAAA